MRELVRNKIERLRSELGRGELDRTTRALHIAGLSLMAARLWPTISVHHERFYELTSAPKQFRGLRDLHVRLASPADAVALSSLDTTPPARVAERFARGNLAYVCELDGRMLAHSWFHRGPTPFDEDTPLFPRWDVPADAYWSFNAYTLPEARTSGVFVKMFQTALRELMLERGATRIRCRVKVANLPSVMLHERLGFTQLGTLIAITMPGARLLWWQDGGRSRRWIERRSRAAVMAFPPHNGA